MELENTTPFAARLLRVERTEENIEATVVVKSTFEFDDAGRTVPAAEQVPIVGDKLETPFGIFHGDGYVRKDGADVCVLASLRLPRPARKADVEIEIGPFRKKLTVF